MIKGSAFRGVHGPVPGGYGSEPPVPRFEKSEPEPNRVENGFGYGFEP